MSDATPSRATSADGLGHYSAAAGVLAVVLSVIARMLVAYIDASEVNSGHPESDWPSFFAPAPGYVCAVIAIALGIGGLRAGTAARTSAIVGVTIGLTFLAVSLAQYPVDLVYQSVRIEQGPL